MRVIILVALLALAPLLGLSQIAEVIPEREAFSGTWILNYKKSYPNALSNNVKWSISVTGEEFRIQKTYMIGNKPYQYELTLFSDSRGEKNLVPPVKDLPSQTILSKTKWDKNNLVRRYKTASYPTPMFTNELTEKYSLSKDGSQLTVETRVITSDFPDPGGQIIMPRKSVFDREK